MSAGNTVDFEYPILRMEFVDFLIVGGIIVVALFLYLTMGRP